MKEDERAFLLWFAAEFVTRDKEPKTWRELLTTGIDYKTPRDYDLIPFKRKIYLLEKWTDKGWYDYGVSTDLGWLTPKGLAKVQELLEEPF